MRYIKTDYFDKFKCTAGACPDTCCAGWQIVIDEESLMYYEQVQGGFGNRLRDAVNWEEGVFEQYKKRCCLLNDDNLCDLHTELGEQALCDTCRNYPRHTEEFEGLRELSLSLSCPVAAKMVLSAEKSAEFTEYETEEEEELAEEFEDFDFLMFTQLEDARSIIFQIIKNQSLSLEERISITTKLAEEMDTCVQEGRYSDIDTLLLKYQNSGGGLVLEENSDFGYPLLKRNFAVFYQMELLRDEWEARRELVWNTLYDCGEEEYNKLRQRFDSSAIIPDGGKVSLLQMAENLLVAFVFTWFCGAVYDDWIYSKMAMAAFCTVYILEFIMAEWAQNGEKISFEECVRITYSFTREVEHSDLNLNTLEEWLNQHR